METTKNDKKSRKTTKNVLLIYLKYNFSIKNTFIVDNHV